MELVGVMLEKEQAKNSAGDLRPDKRATTTLESLEGTENKRRQMLMEELDGKDAQLYDARKEIRDLGENSLPTIKQRQPLWSKFRCPSPPFHQLSSLSLHYRHSPLL